MANCRADCMGSDRYSEEYRRHKKRFRLGNDSAWAQAATWKTFANVSVDKNGKGYVELKQNGYTFGALIFPQEKMSRDRVDDVTGIEDRIRGRAEFYVKHTTNAYYAISYHTMAFQELEDAAFNAFKAVISSDIDEYNRKNKGEFKIIRKGHVIYKTEKGGSKRLLGLDWLMKCHYWNHALLHENFIHSVMGKKRKTNSIAVELRAAEDAYNNGDTALAKLHAGRGLKAARKLGNDLRMTNLHKASRAVEIADKVV